MFDKLNETAKRRGASRVLVAGVKGALSNYPLTIHYVTSKYIDGKTPVTLSEDFNFNKYNLTENCYVVREVNNA